MNQLRVITPTIFLKRLKLVHSLLFILLVVFLVFSIWSMQSIFEVLTIPNDLLLIIVAVLLAVCLAIEKIIFNIRLKYSRNSNTLREKILNYYKIRADGYLILALIIAFSVVCPFLVNASIYLAFSIILLMYYARLRVSKKKVILDLNLQGEFLAQFHKLDEALF